MYVEGNDKIAKFKQSKFEMVKLEFRSGNVIFGSGILIEARAHDNGSEHEVVVVFEEEVENTKGLKIRHEIIKFLNKDDIENRSHIFVPSSLVAVRKR